MSCRSIQPVYDVMFQEFSAQFQESSFLSSQDCLHEGDAEHEDEPHVDHLDVGRVGQVVGHGDEERGEHEQRRQVHRHDGLEEERLEEVGAERHQADQDGGKVRRQNLVQKPAQR